MKIRLIWSPLVVLDKLPHSIYFTETYLPSINMTIAKGLHILGELKVELPEDVWERPADQTRKLTPSGEASNQHLFDLSADIEVKKDGLYWTIRMPRMNTSYGMVAMQACQDCFVSIGRNSFTIAAV